MFERTPKGDRHAFQRNPTQRVFSSRGRLHSLAASRPRALGREHAELTSRETVTVAADEPIPNLPGKRLVAISSTTPQGDARPRTVTPARLSSTPTSSRARSGASEPARVYRAGEAWFESPGSHHRVSENASDTRPARLLAVLIVDAADKQLVIPDPQ
jgi:quercetin dioxygenase-like cupin family protein